MVFIFLLNIFNVNQAKIDWAMEMIRPHYAETITNQYRSNPPRTDFQPGGLIAYRTDYTITITRDDIVIGDEPAETLNIAGYFYHHGNIIVINDGVLDIKNADFNLEGNIAVANHGEVLIDSSAVNFIQHYIYEHLIQVTDSASFAIHNSQSDFNGYQINIAVQGAGEFVMDNVLNHDWITAGVSQNARVFLNRVDYTGEWLFLDDCYGQFKHVDYFLSWFFFPNSSAVNFTFPDGDTVIGFKIDSTLINVDGIGYRVTIDSSTNCMWAAIPLRGSDVTFNNSELRLTGLMFEGTDTFNISGLVNGLSYPDYTVPISDRHYHLINSSVQTWNLYADDTTHLNLSSSIFGECIGFTNSYSVIQNAFCDGSGGHIEANNNTVVLVISSSIFADVITRVRGIGLLANCAMPWGNIWATNASVLILVNTQFPEPPIPADTAIVFVAAIMAPSNANTEDTAGIIGSAWIDTGPYNPLDFNFYRLFYRLTGSSTWIPLGDEKYIEVRDDTLDYWNTVGLEDGIYEVRLILKDTAGDSIEALKQIRLRSTGVTEEMGCDIEYHNIEIKQLGPRLFYVKYYDSRPDIYIYNILGRRIKTIKIPEAYWAAPASGVFFVRDKKANVTKKIIAY